MARVVAFIPDLLFGSNVIGALRAGGHDPVLASSAADLEGELPGADVLVVDLTDDVTARIEVARAALADEQVRARTLAFFSHVESDVRAQALDAGFDLVVPRSRMARATVQLIAELTV
ncbi:MAG: hypothetical protein WAK93_08295 [Solirubrobacteraceae bacterium]